MGQMGRSGFPEKICLILPMSPYWISPRFTPVSEVIIDIENEGRNRGDTKQNNSKQKQTILRAVMIYVFEVYFLYYVYNYIPNLNLNKFARPWSYNSAGGEHMQKHVPIRSRFLFCWKKRRKSLSFFVNVTMKALSVNYRLHGRVSSNTRKHLLSWWGFNGWRLAIILIVTLKQIGTKIFKFDNNFVILRWYYLTT